MDPLERRWIRCDEASALLHLNLKSVYRGVRTGKLPGRKVPGIGVRLDRLAIDKMLEGTAPIPELMPVEPAKAKRGKGKKR